MSTLKDKLGLQPEFRNLVVMAAQADSVAVDVAGVVADLNALLAKLRAAGLMES